ncbi:MAG: hypothetical protein WCG25_10040 [bacterium]
MVSTIVFIFESIFFSLYTNKLSFPLTNEFNLFLVAGHNRHLEEVFEFKDITQFFT